jgi:hypothetical protein
MHRGRPWTPADRTGGPVDDVFDQLRQHVPGLVVERLEVTHRADDDNVYYIGIDDVYECIQLDTRDGGQPPFLIENGGRYETVETAEASSIIRSWLEQSRPPASPT